MNKEEAIAFAQEIANEKKTQWRQVNAPVKKAKDVQAKLIEIRRIAFRDAVREVYGNGYYKD
jgi:hypothetical protein